MAEPLSVVIITRNTERSLEACLLSVAFADEIVIVDSGSSDKTAAIAAYFGARFIFQEWLGYGPQKQFAVEQARHAWVLCIDADERVSETLRINIQQTLQAPASPAYMMPRCNRFMGRWLRHGEGYPDF
ncbi:MAG: glycosyl transferase, partial [Halothiobacillaceae bacterium]